MRTISVILKAIFRCAFVVGLAGSFAGGVAALFIWPGSNLGPPIGAMYGLAFGGVTGAAVGLGWGILLLFNSKSPSQPKDPTNSGKAL
jgi:hypothetical protein